MSNFYRKKKHRGREEDNDDDDDDKDEDDLELKHNIESTMIEILMKRGIEKTC